MDTPTRSQLFARQTHYLSLLQGIRERYGKLAGVDWIGLGLKEREGKLTADWAWRFYVKEKVVASDLAAADLIPAELEGLATDVIPTVEAEKLVTYPTDLNIDNTDFYDAGIRGGIQIRSEYFGDNTHSGYGTLGILARRKDDNALVGLTCAHVVNAGLVVSNSTGHKIGHPHHYVSPCCGCCSKQIGSVSAATATADLDCALIVLDNDVATKVTGAVPSSTENIIENGGADITITGATAAVIGETVRKRGRSTRLTTGTITDVAYGTDAMLIAPVGAGPFAVHGDSGAVVINAQDKVIGLLIAGDKETMNAGVPAKVTMGIATHIKKVMENLNITIAGTDAAFIGLPLDPADPALDWKYWAGGNGTTAFNPTETFASSEFGFAVGTAVDWNVATGGAGASIITADGVAQPASTTSVTNKISIVVRYDTTSTDKELANAVRIVAAKTGQPTGSKFRTIFTVVARAINTSAALNARNTNVFPAAGGTVNNVAGVVIPGTNAATDFLARGEIIYDITPTDLDWGNANRVITQLVTGNPPAAAKGNIRCLRQWKRNAGEQLTAGPNRLHATNEAGFSNATETAATEFMMDPAAPSLMFSNTSFGFSPTGRLQQYLRGDYREFLMIHNGTTWVKFTANTDWFVNLTQPLAADPAAAIGAPLNHMGAGANAVMIPNRTPTATPGAFQVVMTGTAGVSISAVPVDQDNDVVTITWAQTSGTVVALSSTTGNSVTFTAPGAEGPLAFTATPNDGTAALLRPPGNSGGVAVNVKVMVAQLIARTGGDPRLCVNNEETFTSANLGLAGAVTWDVTTGLADATIVEADGASIAPVGTVVATSIKVNYNNVTADATVANAVKIQATSGADVSFTLRSVALVVAPVATAVAVVAPSAGSIALRGANWGLTYPENVLATICAHRDGANWRARLLTVTGNYSLQAVLIAGCTEVTGPGGNTTVGNYCNQMNNLDSLNGPTWYMVSAVTAHENVHAAHFAPALSHATVLPPLTLAIEALTVPHVMGMTQAAAQAALIALPGYAAALTAALANWLAQILVLAAGDHAPGGPTDVAEHGVVDVMVAAICAHSRASGWAACPPLCP
jgi:hypothetical protein